MKVPDKQRSRLRAAALGGSLALIAALGASSCEGDNALEDAAEEVEDAAEDIADEIEDAGN